MVSHLDRICLGGVRADDIAQATQQPAFGAGKIAKPLRGGGGGNQGMTASYSVTGGALGRVQQDEPKRRE